MYRNQNLEFRAREVFLETHSFHMFTNETLQTEIRVRTSDDN